MNGESVGLPSPVLTPDPSQWGTRRRWLCFACPQKGCDCPLLSRGGSLETEGAWVLPVLLWCVDKPLHEPDLRCLWFCDYTCCCMCSVYTVCQAFTVYSQCWDRSKSFLQHRQWPFPWICFLSSWKSFLCSYTGTEVLFVLIFRLLSVPSWPPVSNPPLEAVKVASKRQSKTKPSEC